jgi:hypothetical protein
LRQRQPRVRDSKYLSFVAKMPSVISARKPVHVAHVRYGDPERGKPSTGMGEKPSDKWTLPLTPEEHMVGVRSQHANNEKEWWKSHGVDPIAVCEALYEVYQRYTKGELDKLTTEEQMRSLCLRARAL